MNKLCSIRATTRISGVAKNTIHKNTIQKLTIAVGEACLNSSDKALRNIKTHRVQVDEVWCFCYAKESWRLGARDAANANMFIGDFADRLANNVQLTSDAQLSISMPFRTTSASRRTAPNWSRLTGRSKKDESRYSPAKCLGTKKKPMIGNPDPEHISTSFVERQNLNIRMQNRRYTRLTNAFSKKAEMLNYSIAITFTYHNFVRAHETLSQKGELPTTPAMAAGIAKRQWTIRSAESGGRTHGELYAPDSSCEQLATCDRGTRPKPSFSCFTDSPWAGCCTNRRAYSAPSSLSRLDQAER